MLVYVINTWLKHSSHILARRDCESCDNVENTLIPVREDLVETLNAWVVKAVDSQMTRLYSPTKEPALVFFRHGIPLLYDGKPYIRRCAFNLLKIVIFLHNTFFI